MVFHISKLVDVTQIDGIPPSVFSDCQMAGGLRSPDIYQCLAVQCPHSSALTLGLVLQTCVSCAFMGITRAWSNDAAKSDAVA